MKRRRFIHSVSQSVILTPYLYPGVICASDVKPIGDLDDFVRQLVEANDRVIPGLLKHQQQDPVHPFYGGIPDRYGMFTAGGVASILRTLSAAFYVDGSDYYQSEIIVESINRAAACLLKLQHEDGTINLVTTNFHSTPDTAFVVEHICLAYTLLGRIKDFPADILVSLKSFLIRAGDALSIGGIHTPNHRWVVCMALARINALFANEKYIDRIDEWLAEGIDIDADGQYTEKSTHVYSPLTNRCLITIARLLDRPDLLKPVRRNLEMTLYYIHPNGEIVTEASGRQDKYRIGNLIQYLYPYHYMALHEGNGLFSSMSRYIRTVNSIKLFVSALPLFLEDTTLENKLPDEISRPVNYLRHFEHSKLGRFRRGEVDATILADNPVFFTFQKKNAVLQGLRLASAFFGKGQFKGVELKRFDDQFILEQSLEGPYYQPYPGDQIPGDGNWEKMPRENRAQSEIQYLNSQVKIMEKDGKITIHINISGTDHVPVAMELGFRKGGKLVGVKRLEDIEDAFLLESERGVFSYDDTEINFGPGKADHSWTQLRGALPKMDALSVYVTGFTPFRYELNIG